MLMAENSWGREDFSSLNESVAGDEAVDGADDLSIDMETLFHILDEKREEPNDLQQVGFLKSKNSILRPERRICISFV